MDNCQRFKEMVSDYIEGGLAQQNNQQMEYHFKECLKCSKTTQQLRNLLRELQGLPKVTVSPDFETILRARISIESGLARRRREGFFSSLQFRIPAYAISAVLIILGLMSIFSRIERHRTRMAPPEAYVNQEWYGGVSQHDNSNKDVFIYFLERKPVYNATSQSPARISSFGNQVGTITTSDSAQGVTGANKTFKRINDLQSLIY